MKAVCIRQPEASDIARQWRHVLAMEWETEYRGQLVLCAGSGGPPPSTGEEMALPREMALARAVLSDVHPLTESDVKAAGLKEIPRGQRFAWVFRDVQEIESFSVRQREGIFDIAVEEGELVPLDPTAYEDHLEYYNVVVVPQLETQLADIHDEYSQKPLQPKRSIEDK
jgi:hypothetical protein